MKSPSPKDFHASHAPFGAFSSFTCGYASAQASSATLRGGFSPSTRHPGNQSQFIGWRIPGEAWKLLPFFTARGDAAAAFTGEQADDARFLEGIERYAFIDQSAYSREYGPAIDRFSSGPFSVSFYSPFERIEEWAALPASEQQRLCAPCVFAEISLDNRQGSVPLEAIFGIGDDRMGLRPIEDAKPSLRGFAAGRDYGFACSSEAPVGIRSGMDIFQTNRRDERNLHLLGAEAAVIVRAAPGEVVSLPIALGFYQAGIVTTGIDAAYYYTRFFDTLESVLEYGLKHFSSYKAKAQSVEQELAAKDLSPQQHWLLTHSIRSYLASTQFLKQGDSPLWVVNEGEYRMLNTFDLTVDHLFFELDWWPWAVRDTVDLFSRSYSYHDDIQTPTGERAAGGISFAHDMGVDNQFTRPGTSSYELPNLRGCFSYMSCEQLLNWVCCAVCYAASRQDDAWLLQQRSTLEACMTSLERRDHPEADQRDGLMKWDSSRCGAEGSEITTYDSLDVSLGQARNNLYIGMKSLAAWLLLEWAFQRLGDAASSQRAAEAASRLASTLASRQNADGTFAAVFEDGNQSRIIPAVEGLIYPLYLGMGKELRSLEEASGLLSKLEQHIRKALTEGSCLAANGGWQLSSTSKNTWMSKIFLSQAVVATLWPDLASYDLADQAHMDWQTSETTRKLCFCDQIRSDDGFPLGSRHYPRGVTSWLWLALDPKASTSPRESFTVTA